MSPRSSTKVPVVTRRLNSTMVGIMSAAATHQNPVAITTIITLIALDVAVREVRTIMAPMAAADRTLLRPCFCRCTPNSVQ